MALTTREYDNEHNEAIIFAQELRHILIHETTFPEDCYLREINRIQNPIDVIIDIGSKNKTTTGIVTINDERYTFRGRRERINCVYYVQCIINNYNGYFILAVLNNIEEILEILRFMKEVVDYEPNEEYNLDYVRIPENLLNKWFISKELRELNSY